MPLMSNEMFVSTLSLCDIFATVHSTMAALIWILLESVDLVQEERVECSLIHSVVKEECFHLEGYPGDKSFQTYFSNFLVKT